jgi:transposase InsO family protein
MSELKPKDHAEAVALFRSEIVGALTRRELDHGELREELERLSQKRYRPPGAKTTRRYAASTLERWLYRYKKGGLDALRPEPRSDRGRARELTPEQRELLLDIRREHRAASVSLILRTLVAEGRLNEGAVSAATVRRLYAEHGLDRIARRDGSGPKTRLRWQVEHPGALWHADVCHGPSLLIGKEHKPLRIHGILDDASRYIVALEAQHTEREIDMLRLMVRALRQHGAPDALYLDNGSTYRGDTLRVACGRLGISLLHAKPYDPESRGKMERFWRTLREQCLCYLSKDASLHDVNVRLWSWLGQHYHVAAHAGLLGSCPSAVWARAEQRPDDAIDEQRLRDALTVRERRRVRRDTTVTIEGQEFELDQGFLAGQLITAAWCPLDEPLVPWAELHGKRYPLHPVDRVGNSRRRRPPRREASETDRPKTAFDPNQALLDRAVGRSQRTEEGDR